MVVDVCRDDRTITHTAMHELLHLVGVRHVSGNVRAVMAPSTDGASAPITLTLEDREAITAATGCATW